MYTIVQQKLQKLQKKLQKHFTKIIGKKGQNLAFIHNY